MCKHLLKITKEYGFHIQWENIKNTKGITIRNLTIQPNEIEEFSKFSEKNSIRSLVIWGDEWIKKLNVLPFVNKLHLTVLPKNAKNISKIFPNVETLELVTENFGTTDEIALFNILNQLEKLNHLALICETNNFSFDRIGTNINYLSLECNSTTFKKIIEKAKDTRIKTLHVVLTKSCGENITIAKNNPIKNLRLECVIMIGYYGLELSLEKELDYLIISGFYHSHIHTICDQKEMIVMTKISITGIGIIHKLFIRNSDKMICLSDDICVDYLEIDCLSPNTFLSYCEYPISKSGTLIIRIDFCGVFDCAKCNSIGYTSEHFPCLLRLFYDKFDPIQREEIIHEKNERLYIFYDNDYISIYSLFSFFYCDWKEYKETIERKFKRQKLC